MLEDLEAKCGKRRRGSGCPVARRLEAGSLQVGVLTSRCRSSARGSVSGAHLPLHRAARQEGQPCRGGAAARCGRPRSRIDRLPRRIMRISIPTSIWSTKPLLLPGWPMRRRWTGNGEDYSPGRRSALTHCTEVGVAGADEAETGCTGAPKVSAPLPPPRGQGLPPISGLAGIPGLRGIRRILHRCPTSCPGRFVDCSGYQRQLPLTSAPRAASCRSARAGGSAPMYS
jgi:hypothetical protein